MKETEQIKARVFPKDCPEDCKYLRSWDLSIDDLTYVCTKLNIQIDGCDSWGQFCPSCPLAEEEIQDAIGN